MSRYAPIRLIVREPSSPQGQKALEKRLAEIHGELALEILETSDQTAAWKKAAAKEALRSAKEKQALSSIPKAAENEAPPDDLPLKS